MPCQQLRTLFNEKKEPQRINSSLLRQQHLDKGALHIFRSIQVCSITAKMNTGKEHNRQVKFKENFMSVEGHDVKLWKMSKPGKSG